jgi:glycosyltransferase involved in cell wall biosynthesis
VRDIVVDGVTGVVVPANDPGALGAGLRRALAMDEDAGVAARAHCEEQYDLERIVDQWHALLERIGTEP